MLAGGGTTAPNDSDGDGFADLLLRHADGTFVLSKMQGPNVISSDTLAVANAADMKLVAHADFTGDRRADLLLRARTDGSWHLLQLEGTTIAATAGLAITQNVDWQPVGTGDFDGDGGTSLLLRHARGTWFLYRIRNGALVGSSNVGGLPEGSEHRLVAAPDLNG
ncbi:MAG: hypothetical protein CMQ24_17695, partial [Gammaproteobacteria bacterium]|nr:hypothetical protein [Gammaproteobacteria bacterium]